MQKLRKVRYVRTDTVEAYTCKCGCTCSCRCNCSCLQNNTLDNVSNDSRTLSNTKNSNDKSLFNTADSGARSKLRGF